ncbi:MAG: MnhB domain-containing protein [Armatimonadota bacterium]|nr:MnhB domain-containing protein [Armatimonadota bacterium]MDR7387872.1 MnhB domain-containing protein [Armatimonadota bacterium]MDR7389354.1 MnhB domain-containing protein [Armatimonadota bacterium]MDR7393974.1 MnhB domain-containing protein [Armatimonadota bacterium]MDR7399691.1 MnhB domain-containing protein [Armatimonadota bacterium]
MNSLVLRTVARVVAPVVVLYGVRLLLVGHNSPGGGFVGGLVTALAVVLGWLAFGPPPRARRWERGVALGVGISAVTGLAAVLLGRPFLTHAVLYAGPVKLPTSLFFDVGVFLVVVSATLAAVRTLWEAGS